MAKGTSGYLKPKKKTLAELDEMSGNKQPAKNPIDRVVEKQDIEDQESRGITERIRNIFDW